MLLGCLAKCIQLSKVVTRVQLIMGIAFRVGQKTLRRRRTQPVDGDHVARGLTTSIASEEVPELRDWLTKGLAHLASDQRLVLGLIYGEGYGADDVATITGVRIRTVKARLRRARVNLSNVLPVLTGELPETPALASLRWMARSPLPSTVCDRGGFGVVQL
jgi:hypothetical protein